MDDERFRKYYSAMKAAGETADAFLQDTRNCPLRPDVRRVHEDVLADLEDTFDRLRADPQGLTMTQLRSLRSITFCTPGHKNPQDCEVDHFEIIEPLTGPVFGSIKDMPNDDRKMLLLLSGLGSARVQGTISEYKPVMIDRRRDIK